jgi:hypothetical protein
MRIVSHGLALIAVFAGIAGADYLNTMLGNMWLNTHLTSAGELASTYVPTDFPLFSAAEDSVSSV